MLSTEFQLIFVAVTAFLMAKGIWNPPTPTYPPAAPGDHGTVPFMFVVAALGGITAVAGLASTFGFFNWVVGNGRKCRFFRYTSPCTDLIFIGLAVGAIVVSRDTPSLGLPHQCPCLSMVMLTSACSRRQPKTWAMEARNACQTWVPIRAVST